jgi:hypothetical protein
MEFGKIKIRGRPPIFRKPEEMAAQIEDYFNSLPLVRNSLGLEEYRPTQSGLALHLGFEDRFSLTQYEAKPEFTYIIRQAKSLITSLHEGRMHEPSCSGSKFILQNMGYDKGETVINNNIELDLSKMPVIQKLLKYVPSENIEKAMQELEIAENEAKND